MNGIRKKISIFLEDNIRQKLKQAENSFKTFGRIANQTVKNIGSAIDGLGNGLRKLDTMLGTVNQSLKQVSATTAKGLVTGAVAGTTGAFGLAKMTEDIEKDRVKLQQQMQLSKEELEKYMGVINGIYSTGIVEDKTQVMEALKLQIQLNPNLDEKELKKNVEQILANQTIGGFDTKEYTEAVQKVSANTGRSVEESINFLNTYGKEVADLRSDSLDNITEYLNHTTQLGFSEEDFIAIGKMASQGAGYTNDKAFDSLKELQVKLQSDDDVKKMLQSFGNSKEDIKRLMAMFNDSQTNQERYGKMTDYMLRQMYNMNEKDREKSMTSVFGVVGGEDGKKFVEDFIRAYNEGLLGNTVKIKDTANENVEALQDVSGIQAIINQFKLKFEETLLENDLTSIFLDDNGELREHFVLIMEYADDFTEFIADISAELEEFAKNDPEEFKKALTTIATALAAIIASPALVGLLRILAAIGIATTGVTKVFKGLYKALGWILTLFGINILGEEDEDGKKKKKKGKKPKGDLPIDGKNSKVDRFFNFFKNVSDDMGKLGKAKGLTKAFGLLKSIFKNAHPLLRVLFVAVSLLSIIGKGYMNLIKNIFDLLFNGDKYEDLSLRLFEIMYQTFTEIFIAPLVDVLNWVLKLFGLNTIEMESVLNIMKNFAYDVNENFEEALVKMKEFYNKWLKPGLDYAIDSFKESLEIWKSIGNLLDILATGFMDMLSTAIDKIKEFFDISDTKIGKWINDKLDKFNNSDKATKLQKDVYGGTISVNNTFNNTSRVSSSEILMQVNRSTNNLALSKIR